MTGLAPKTLPAGCRRARGSWGLALLVCLLLALMPADAAPKAAAKVQASQPPFALVEPGLAASLSGRAASVHTRAVLIHAAANQGRSARPVAWVSGEADSIAALQDLPALLDMALAWRLGWDAQGVAASAQAGRFRDSALAWTDAWTRNCRASFMPLNESRFDSLLVAWDLIRAAAGPELQERVGGWVRTLAEGYLVDRNGQPRAEQGIY